MKIDKDFSNDEVKQLWQNFGTISQNKLFQCFDIEIKELNKLTETYKEYYESLSTINEKDKNNFAKLSEFNKAIITLLLKSQEQTIGQNFTDIARAYITDINDLNLDNTLVRKEKFSPFTFNKKDQLLVSLKKFNHNLKFAIIIKKRKILNILHKILRVKPLAFDTYKYRKIPYKLMISDYLGTQLPKLIVDNLQETMKIKSLILLDLWQFDQNFEIQIQNQLLEGKTDSLVLSATDISINEVVNKQKQRLNDLSNRLKESISTVNSSQFEALDQALLCVDTPNMPRKKFDFNDIKIKQERIFIDIDLENKKWINTHKTLMDDWSLDVEIAQLYFTVLNDYTLLHCKISKFIDEHLSLNIEQLREFISSSIKHIQNNGSSKKELNHILKQERIHITNDFIDEILAKTIKKLSGSINQDLEKFKTKTNDLINQVSNKRSFIKSKNYERATRSSEINWLSPKELLNFEALPHFEASIKEIKLFIDANMKQARFKLLAMGTVSDFSLESAQIMLHKKKSTIESTVQVAEEGLNRALGHLDEATALMENIKKEPQEKLHQTITTFNTEIQKLKNVANILELNLQIVKIKTIERSKKLRTDSLTWILNIIPKTIDFAKKYISGTTEHVIKLKKYIGVNVEAAQISHELPEFIRQTEFALKKLPFVYQRLYQLTPTDEDRFFVSRKLELDDLEKAFLDWNKDRFITTALISEKGSGTTSLLKIFLSKIETDIPIIHQSADKKIYNRETYLDFFAAILKQEEFESNEEIITFLNNESDNLILILENLQHFFIKKVTGFECQKRLFELISRTSKKVFWIGTYTTHSWEYLKKTITISEHFIREIHLQKFDGETLDEVIFKRNNLSGYKIIFEPSRESKSSKSFQKLNAEEKQMYLRKQFFIELNQMSNGNVSLAQLYWLRSTCSVSDDTINISSLRGIDVSFVKNLPGEQLFAMHTILIHDGLNLKDYAKSLSIPENTCRNILIPMLEKGLLIRPKEKFNINPIIFRQVVSLLKSHNFIN